MPVWNHFDVLGSDVSVIALSSLKSEANKPSSTKKLVIANAQEECHAFLYNMTCIRHE